MINAQMELTFTHTREDQTARMTAIEFVNMDSAAQAEYLYTGKDEVLYICYLAWRKKNPLILSRFFQHASEIHQAGWANYSQWAIVGVMRYQHDLKKGPAEQFKIPNGFIAFLARDYILQNPHRFGFFTLRELGHK